ncbi:MAG TPA: hypothetical protein VMT52_06095, partial [Planctomycetota bacterium]|nr:hypothetical protein [Planctomycetota bacterium]
MARRSICLLLAFQLAMVSSAPRWSPCVRGEEGKADAGADLRARKRERERLERLFRAVSAVSLEAPRDAFDPQGVIDRVGREPSRLFAWVRDETIWVPYAGLLRGPEGVLMDRMGNSLDRSLLLARLLQGSGHQARLVQGEIPLERARELLDRLRSNPSREEESGSAGDSRSAGARAREICDRFGIDFDEIQRSRAAFEVESSRLAEDVTSWTE